MKFEQIRMFNWFFAIIPLIILMIIHYFRCFPIMRRLITSYTSVDSRNDTHKTKKKSVFERELQLRYIFSCFFLIGFFCFVIFALADPRSGALLVPELRHGTDIVLAFDISRSMNVRDAPSIDGAVSASRLERSVYIAKNVISYYKNNGKNINVRFGVAIGKGMGILAVPLTDDTEAVFALLDSLSILSITSTGTNLEKLLEASGGAFPSNFPSGREIVLFTDGEELSGSLSAALEHLNRNNINVFAIGVGSIYGAQVPDSGGQAEAGGRRKTTPVISYLRETSLKSAVERTGGSYIDGNRDEAAFLLAEEIGPLSAESSWTFREEPGSMWAVFLVFALIMLALSKASTKRIHIKDNIL